MTELDSKVVNVTWHTASVIRCLRASVRLRTDILRLRAELGRRSGVQDLGAHYSPAPAVGDPGEIAAAAPKGQRLPFVI